MRNKLIIFSVLLLLAIPIASASEIDVLSGIFSMFSINGAIISMIIGGLIGFFITRSLIWVVPFAGMALVFYFIICLLILLGLVAIN